MLLQYNFQNSKIGQTKVNVIYSKNQTLSKVTIINGTRFRINYPYNITNNLTSNVLVIQKIKFGEAKLKSPVSIPSGTTDSASLGLNIRKVRVLSQSVDKKLNEKCLKENNFFNKSSTNNNIITNNHIGNYNEYINSNNHNFSGRVSLKIARKKSHDNLDSSSLKLKEVENIDLDSINNVNSNKNGNLENSNNKEKIKNNIKIISPIMNMPLNITKTKILPSINNNNKVVSNYQNFRSSTSNLNVNNGNNNSNSTVNPELGSPGKIRMNFLKRLRYNNENGDVARGSINGINLKQNMKDVNIENILSENKENNGNENICENNRYEGSPNGKKNIDNRLEKSSLILNNNPNMKHYLFIVKPGNNPDVVRKCFNHRANWKESGNLFTTAYNYKWGQNKKSMEFCLLNKKNVNRKKNNLNAFDYIPFTIIAKINSNNFKENFKNFTEIFKNITKYLENATPKSSSNIKKREAYGDFFKNEINDYKACNTEIKFPTTHYAGNNLWLLKPTDLCGGRCIQISDNIEELEKLIKKFFDGMERSLKAKEDEEEDSLDEDDNNDDDKNKKPGVGVKYRASTVLIQKYIESPLLYFGRKFDVRMWVLITHKLEVYMFKEGHLKTTSIEYTTESKDKFIHITNYSLQKHNNNFNKYEEGNELSFKDFQDFLDKEYPEHNIKVKEDFYPQMIDIIKHSTLAIKDKLNKKKRQYCYVTLGYDFMIDSDLRVWLIEINKNPGLCESSNIIKMLIPRMIDDSLRLTLDDIFEPRYVNNDFNNYKSPYPVEGYEDTENMWKYLVTLYPSENPEKN